MPDSYGIDFEADGFLGPNKFPMPIAIKATRVANRIISAIATYSSITTPQNVHKRTIFVKFGTV
jgi:hypothetical protein